MGQEQTHIRRLRSQPMAPGFSPDKIDAEAGVIRDVVMVEEGPAKGHGVSLEAEFIRDLVAYDRTHYGERGVKARLGHPGMSSDAMGTQLGFFRNVRKRETGGKMQAIADLHLLDSADLSPDKPNARAWVLQMAVEAPDFIMSSIVFKPGAHYQRKGNGNKRYVDPYGWDGQLPSVDPELGDVFVEFGENGAHYNTDLVEQGAATDHLFSHDANPQLFVVQAETFLQEHPHLIDFLKNNPDKVRAFVDRFAAMPDKTNEAMSNPTAPVLELSADTLEEQLEQARNEGAEAASQAFENRVEQLETALSAVQTTVAQYEQHFAALTARLSALETKPAAEHTAGEAQTALAEDKPYLKNPLYLQAKAMQGSRNGETN